ncbi:MAG TPA: hypothetical protein VMO80_07245 [Terriglobales bacterium]|nr:hypothetical protein [Terriglobales bacterium]
MVQYCFSEGIRDVSTRNRRRPRAGHKAPNAPGNEIPVNQTQAHEIHDEDPTKDQHNASRKTYLGAIREWWNDPFRERASWTDKAVVFLTFGIVLLAYMQWREMHDSGAQTDRIIAADERIATAMEGVVGQGKKSLDATIEQNRLDQRAWVGPTTVSTFELKADQSIPVIGVTFRNNGKTPALKFGSHVALNASKKGDPFHPIYHHAGSRPSIDVLQPNGELVLNTNPSSNKLTEQNIRDIRNGDLLLYLFGKGNYDDIFGVTHHVTFCMYVSPDLKHVQSCDTYNEAD